MIKKRHIGILFLLFLSVSSMYFECGKDYGPPPKIEYWFKSSVQIAPYQLNYHIGDTVWLSVNLPGKELYDTISRQMVHYDSANFNAEADVKLLYNNPFIKDGPFASFVFPENVSGSTGNSDGSTGASIDFGCAPAPAPAPDYSLRLGIVMLQSGAFELSFANRNISKCFTGLGQYVQMTFVFDVPDTHLSFYQGLPLSSVGLTQDYYITGNLQNKYSVAINVQ